MHFFSGEPRRKTFFILPPMVPIRNMNISDFLQFQLYYLGHVSLNSTDKTVQTFLL